MTKVHTIRHGFKTQLVADPEYARQAAAEIVADSMEQPSNTAIQDALTAATTSSTTERSIMQNPERNTTFSSTRLASRLGFALSANVGKLATRIQKLANPPKSSKQDPAEIKSEMRECVAALIWGYDNIGEQMRELEEAVNEWCGGGYSRPRSDEEINAVATALHISPEQAKQSAETNRIHSRDFLTVRRAGLAPVMVEKISTLLSSSNIEAVPPTDEMIEAAAVATFQNAILWGDWAEAALVQADASEWLGKTLDIPAPDKAQQDKAARIREELAKKQADQAAADAQALVAYDIDLAA